MAGFVVFLVIFGLLGVSGFTIQPGTKGMRLRIASSTLKPRDRGLKMSSRPHWREQLTVLRKNKRQRLYRWCDKATGVFPLWTIAASVVGFKYPQAFLGFKPYVTPALAATMLAMGMTLTINDFKRISKSPTDVLVGFFAQFSIMPTVAYTISQALKLSPELSAGLILVGCAPGGTASNLVTLIAGADVALSVLMTLVSTTAAIFLTPYLTSLLAGGFVEVKAKELVLSTVSVVFAPVLAGLIMNTQAPKACATASKVTPAISCFLIAAICGCVQAMNATAANVLSIKLLSAIALLHSFGFGLGYIVAKLLGLSGRKARTVSIETGMQNSALAVVLAEHFPDPVTSGLPGAFSATIHSTLGSILAAWWRRNPVMAPGSWSPGGIKDAEGDTVVQPPDSGLPAKPLPPDSIRGSDEGVA